MTRPSEVRAITALLEAEHDDVEALARAVIDQLDELRATRPSFVVRLGWDDRDRFAVGPFPDRNAAYRAVRKIAPDLSRDDAQRVIAVVKPPAWWTTTIADEARKGTCSGCGHPTHCHNWPKFRKKHRGCVVSLSPKGEAGSNLCPCLEDGT